MSKYKIISNVLTGLAICLLACPVLCGTFKLGPTDDIYVSNKYSQPGEKATAHKIVIQSSGFVKFIYLRFNLQGVTGAVQSATLTLEHNEGVEDAYPVNFKIVGSRDAPAWQESGLMLSNAPNGPVIGPPPALTRGDWVLIGYPYSISRSADGQLHDFDVTSYMAWECGQGDRIATIIIVPMSGAFRFTSSEAYSSEVPPKLTIVTGITAINKNAKKKSADIRVYPNPGRPPYHIVFSNHKKMGNPCHLRLFDLQGQLIRHWQLGQSGKLTDLQSGVYFLKLISKAGETSAKLIVLH
jgi:hypothetical protein